MEQQTTQVLVVDDNPEIRDIIHVLLEGEGIRVTEAADGSSALHFLEKGSFDLIILDIMMPKLDGLASAGSFLLTAVSSSIVRCYPK